MTATEKKPRKPRTTKDKAESAYDKVAALGVEDVFRFCNLLQTKSPKLASWIAADLNGHASA